VKPSAVLSVGIAMILLAGCSRGPKFHACDLIALSEAQSVDASIAKTEPFPPQKGEELCVYLDQAGERRLMLFIWRDKKSDAFTLVRDGMRDARDRVVPVVGVGNSAAAGFSAAEGEVLKLFAAESKGAMIGLRVRDPVKEGDDKYQRVRALAASAVGRLK
jgi:hypothetical protein